MKVKVIRDFKDREHNLKLRRKGEKFDVSEARAEKLLALGYVEMVTESRKEEKAAK